MYIEREIQPTLDTMLRRGKVVLVTGARQVGKNIPHAIIIAPSEFIAEVYLDPALPKY